MSGGLSLKPEDAEAGGMLDDVDATLTSLRFTMFDYNGQTDDTPALQVTIQVDGDDDEHEEYYSAGSADRVKPSKDGKRLEAADDSEAKGLKKTTKAAHFIKSLVDAGFDPDKIEDEVDCFDGVRVHLNQKPWKGYMAKEGATILLVTKILDGKSSGGGKGKDAGKKGGGADAITKKADEAIEALLEDAPKGKLAKDKLSTLVFKHLRKDPDVKKVTELVLEDEYLEGDDRPFDYDGDTIVKK